MMASSPGAQKWFDSENDYFNHSPTSGKPLEPILESTTTTTTEEKMERYTLSPSPVDDEYCTESNKSKGSSTRTPSPSFRGRRDFRLEDYTYMLSSLQHRNPNNRTPRRKEGGGGGRTLKESGMRAVIPPEIPRPSPHSAEESDLFIPALHSLAALCVRKPEKDNVALAFAIGGGERNTRKSTIYVAQSGNVAPEVEEHLKEMWRKMQGISKCLEEKKRPSSIRSGISVRSNDSQRSIKRTAEGRNIRSELLGLERAALSFSVAKVSRRVLKRWEVFDKFVESLKKERTRGEVPKGTSMILVKIRNSLESPVKLLQRKKDPGGLDSAILSAICDELIFVERTWKRENAAISEETFAVINDAASRFSMAYHAKRRQTIDPVQLVDVRKYIDKIFLLFDHCHVLEELAYSWSVVDILSGELDVVRVDAQYRDVDNLPTLEADMKMLIESTFEEVGEELPNEDKMGRYLRHLRKHPLIRRDSVRVPVHYECNLISYIHRTFAVPHSESQDDGGSSTECSPASSSPVLQQQQQQQQQQHTPFPYLGVSKLSCDMCRRFIGTYNAHHNTSSPTTSTSTNSPHQLLFNKTFSDTPACVENYRGSYYALDGIDLRGITCWAAPTLGDKGLESAIVSELVSAVTEEIRTLEMPSSDESSSSGLQQGYDGQDSRRPSLAKEGRRASLMARLGISRIGSFSGMFPGLGGRKSSYSKGGRDKETQQEKSASGGGDEQGGGEGKKHTRNLSLSFEVGRGRMGKRMASL